MSRDNRSKQDRDARRDGAKRSDSRRSAAKPDAVKPGDAKRSYAKRGDNDRFGSRQSESRRTDVRRTESRRYDQKRELLDQNEAIRTESDREYIIGRNPVMEALTSGREIERLFIADGATGSVAKLKALAKERGIIMDVVDRTRLDRIVPGEKHQGVVAEISAYKYAELDDVFARATSSGEDPFIVILDEIEDPHNLGAVIRTAECAGAHGVIILKRRASGLNSTVAKSSAGAIESIPVVRVSNMTRTIDEFKERGIWIAACDMDGESYYDCDLCGPIAIVIGNEGKGISRLVKEHCDFTVSIPLMGSINSLNASNAAAVIMYEVRRQRLQK